jgi:hypothetical protein
MNVLLTVLNGCNLSVLELAGTSFGEDTSRHQSELITAWEVQFA